MNKIEIKIENNNFNKSYFEDKLPKMIAKRIIALYEEEKNSQKN